MLKLVLGGRKLEDGATVGDVGVSKDMPVCVVNGTDNLKTLPLYSVSALFV